VSTPSSAVILRFQAIRSNLGDGRHLRGLLDVTAIP
jgi:hypothetical protein